MPAPDEVFQYFEASGQASLRVFPGRTSRGMDIFSSPENRVSLICQQLEMIALTRVVGPANGDILAEVVFHDHLNLVVTRRTQCRYARVGEMELSIAA